MTGGGTASYVATPVVKNGDPREKWNLVVLGDGYRANQIASFRRHVKDFAATLQATPPFDALWPAINVYRINVTSTDSGADDPKDPKECGGTGAKRTTYFDATFCSPWGDKYLARLLTVDSAFALAIAKDRVPRTHQVLVIVNSKKYGGSGVGGVAVCSKDPQGFRVAIHEIGHSAFHLADEYDDPDLPTPAREPPEPNITIKATRANGKWGDLIKQRTPVPSSRNSPRCGNFAAIEPFPAGDVGAFEGGGYSACGVFRPAAACRMRHTDDKFCPACVRVIRKTLNEFLVKRVDLIKKGNEWVAKTRSGVVIARAPKKVDAVRKTARAAQRDQQPVSVRIHNMNGRIQEERTYPRKADPRRSEG
jgi:hypothetical protein